MPTLPLNEYTWRAATLAAAIHASKTNETNLLFGSALTSFFYSLLESNAKSTYHSEASLNLKEGLPLWRVEAATTALYVSTVASSRFKLGYASRAALSGMLCVLLRFPTEINAVRYVWTSYHDTNPAVQERTASVPVSTLMSAAALASTSSFLHRWTNETTGYVASTWLSELLAKNENASKMGSYAELLTRACALIDEASETLRTKPEAYKWIVNCVLTPAVVASLIAFFQLAAFERLGSPTRRSYALMGSAYVLAIQRGLASLDRRAKNPLFSPISSTIQKADRSLYSVLIGLSTVQLVLKVLGDPSTHASTGKHQPFNANEKNSFFHLRGEPTEHSKNDFVIDSAEKKKLLAEKQSKLNALEDVTFALSKLQTEKSEIIQTQIDTKSLLSARKMPRSITSRNEADVKRLMASVEANTSVALAAIGSTLISRMERIDVQTKKLNDRKIRILNELRRISDDLDKRNSDPSGRSFVSPSRVGHSAEWYTIRGTTPSTVVKSQETSMSVVATVLALIAFRRTLIA